MEEVLDYAITLAKHAKDVFELYNEIILKNNFEDILKLKECINKETLIYEEIKNKGLLSKINAYIIKALEIVKDNPSNTVLFLRINDILETYILKELESSKRESINNAIAKSIESTCLINGLFLLERNTNLNKVKYELARYNRIIEEILLNNNFNVPCINYQEPLLFSNLYGFNNKEVFKLMRFDIVSHLISEFYLNISDGIDEKNMTKVIEYSYLLKGSLGILDKEEQIIIEKKLINSSTKEVLPYLVFIFNNLDKDINLIKSNSIKLILE